MCFYNSSFICLVVFQ